MLYHLNSGSARNGPQDHHKHFATLDEAKVFRDKFNKFLSQSEFDEEYLEFLDAYCWGGHLISVGDIYEITKTKVA